MTANSDEVITWYAFQCPSTKREYFYEPISGKKTWTLPTSKHITSNTHKKAKHQVTHRPSASESRQENKMGINSNPPTKLGVVIAMTVVVSLICNTVFLVALVKFTGPHNIESISARKIFDAAPEEGYDKPLNISSPDLTSKDSKADEVTAHDVPEEEEEDGNDVLADVSNGPSDESDQRADVTANEDLDENEYKEKTHKETTHTEQEVIEEEESSKQNHVDEVEQKDSTDGINNETPNTESLMQEITNPIEVRNKDSSEVPPQECWVPFAYVFNSRCRRNVETGLKKPMFDAEQFARAII